MKFFTAFLALVMVTVFSLAAIAAPKLKIDLALDTGNQIALEHAAVSPQSVEQLTAFRFINDDRANTAIGSVNSAADPMSYDNIKERSIFTLDTLTGPAETAPPDNYGSGGFNPGLDFRPDKRLSRFSVVTEYTAGFIWRN